MSRRVSSRRSRFSPVTPGLDLAFTIEAEIDAPLSSGTSPDGERRLDTTALFIMIGAAPNTDWLAEHIELDERGFVLTGEKVDRDSPYETSKPGIFAVGDVRAGSVKRVASGVGEGSVVVSRIWSPPEMKTMSDRLIMSTYFSASESLRSQMRCGLVGGAALP